MSFDDVTAWIEAHPIEASLLGGAGVLAVLWLLGFFSASPATSSDGGQTSLASAYYAAEAQQAVVGGQLQAATIAATRDTAVATLQANAAEAIAATQATAATTINGQNAGVASALGNDQLLAAESNDTANLAAVQSNNAALVSVDASKNSASILQTIYGKLIPTELLLTGGRAAVSGQQGAIRVAPQPGRLSPAAARARGYTSAEYTALTGLPGWAKKKAAT